MRHIAIGTMLLALLAPIAAASPLADGADDVLPGAARAACAFLPDHGVRDGTLPKTPEPHLADQLKAMEDDFEDPRAWCRSNAEALSDPVSIETFV